VSLSLQFKGYTEKMGRVIGMDQSGWDTFLLYRRDTKRQVQSLLEMSLSALIPSSRSLYGLSSKQVIDPYARLWHQPASTSVYLHGMNLAHPLIQAHILGPLLKIRFADKGSLVGTPHDHTHDTRKPLVCSAPFYIEFYISVFVLY
jgi:hypothetical protein